MRSPLDWRAIIAGLAVAASSLALGAAVDTRDQTKANTAEIKRVEDVQAERNSAILDKLDEIRADIKAMKGHP